MNQIEKIFIDTFQFMRNVVRAIIIENDSILVLKRVKNGETYWVFPGGGIDDGESNADALVRECEEELGLVVEVLKQAFENIFVNKEFGEQDECFYYCRIVGGQLGAGTGEEYKPNSHYSGTYEPVWVSLNEIKNLDLRPLEMKKKLFT